MTKLRFIPNEDLEALFARARFRPRELARRCGVSLRTLERHILAQRRMTPGELGMQLRMSKARRLLAAGCSVKATAAECGYDQAWNFSRAFTMFHGRAPSFSRRPREDMTAVEYFISSGERMPAALTGATLAEWTRTQSISRPGGLL